MHVSKHKAAIFAERKKADEIPIPQTAWKPDKKEEFFLVNEKGAPQELLKPELWDKTAGAFWRLHERELLALIVFSSVYLLGVIF